MVIKDERASIARVSNEWKIDASMHAPTPTPTRSFALDRCYSCAVTSFSIFTETTVKERQQQHHQTKVRSSPRETNAYASFSWAAFKFYECLPRSLEARANVIVGVRSPTDCRSEVLAIHLTKLHDVVADSDFRNLSTECSVFFFHRFARDAVERERKKEKRNAHIL